MNNQKFYPNISKPFLLFVAFLAVLFFVSTTIKAQTNDSEIVELLKEQNKMLQHRLDVLEKMTDDLLWYQRVGDLAYIDKVYIP